MRSLIDSKIGLVIVGCLVLGFSLVLMWWLVFFGDLSFAFVGFLSRAVLVVLR